MEDTVKKRLLESAQVKQEMAKGPLAGRVSKAAGAILECYRSGGKVIVFGNGGSAADAQHIVAELVGRFKMERKPLPAVCLNTNVSTLTAVGNDYGFERVFEREMSCLAKKGDVVMGISTSGNSRNVILALDAAKALGAVTIGLTGSKGGKVQDSVDILINVPSDDTPRIQEAHITIGHILCELVEKGLF